MHTTRSAEALSRNGDGPLAIISPVDSALRTHLGTKVATGGLVAYRALGVPQP